MLLAAVAGLLAGVLLILLLRGCNSTPKQSRSEDQATAQTPSQEATQPPEQSVAQGNALRVEDLSFARLSDSELRLSWSDALDAQAAGYAVFRRSATQEDWAELGRVDSDGVVSGDVHLWTDAHDSTEPQQFLYRIDVIPPRDGADNAEAGAVVLASNRSVCIDPGHYLGSSALEGTELYDYGEGNFMLQVGLALRDVLRTEYGIDSVLTRQTDDITLGGYRNEELDNLHLSLRGEYAQGQDLFVSLHTNANQDDANGYPTCNQPTAITKTLVFVNLPGAASEQTLLQANEIGTRLSQVNCALGFSDSDRFDRVSTGRLHDWSDDYNDALNTPGSVCQRLGDLQKDYYGVLRGAASVGVPGMIIEHGFHTVAEMRRAAMEGALAAQWASADAAGIASGYGFSAAETLKGA